MRTFTVSKLLVIIAFVIFVLGAFHVALPVDMIAAGLAFLSASFLVP